MHPIIGVSLVWIVLALPVLMFIENLPKYSEIRIALIIVAYFIAALFFVFIVPRLKFYKEAIAEYKAKKQASKTEQERNAPSPVPPPAGDISDIAKKLAEEYRTRR